MFGRNLNMLIRSTIEFIEVERDKIRVATANAFVTDKYFNDSIYWY